MTLTPLQEMKPCPVTQADRDAAAELTGEEAMAYGMVDLSDAVQAFARHRLAALTPSQPSQEDVERVALAITQTLYRRDARGKVEHPSSVMKDAARSAIAALTRPPVEPIQEPSPVQRALLDQITRFAAKASSSVEPSLQARRLLDAEIEPNREVDLLAEDVPPLVLEAEALRAIEKALSLPALSGRDEVLEEAAKVADKETSRLAAIVRATDGDDDEAAFRVTTAGDIAKAIRALKGQSLLGSGGEDV